jgi:hypothetical protein
MIVDSSDSVKAIPRQPSAGISSNNIVSYLDERLRVAPINPRTPPARGTHPRILSNNTAISPKVVSLELSKDFPIVIRE